jgi:hypothetical protein
VKGDAVLRVSRESWKRAAAFADRMGRKLREVTGTALDEYIKREEAKKKR